MHDLNYADAIAKAEHLLAIGVTDVYLRREGEYPWSSAVRVVTGSSYRLNGPSSVNVVAEEAGLTFRWSVDFEQVDANGRGVSLFDRDRLRETMRKLPPVARQSFASILKGPVLSALESRTNEIRESLNLQLDSEDCVRGLIAYAEAPTP